MDVENKKYGYFSGIIYGLWTLLKGMKVTFVEFFTPKTTECYPENRASLALSERFRGTLVMADASKCIACSLCELACPNDTLCLDIEVITDETTGKKRKEMRRYGYDLGSCMFCQLCVNACPTGAIAFDTSFEHAVFERDKLIKNLINKI
ncbi:MAG: 4Fe-4S binding protein [Tannerella sp.]|jgi:NADH-quinone oxidoreductase subunit I|nr:4Fe-4S binding protein [Tannerella sp.]